jgi:glucose/mannose transport system substrate-binding protein
MRVRVVTALLLVLALGACGSEAPTSATEDTKQLEIVSWWTSGSEAAALKVLLDAFQQTHPDVTPVNAAIASGAGSQAIVELAKRLQKGDPPDVWQTFDGKSVQGYAARGAVRELGSIFSTELRTTMQPAILQSLMRDGSPYGMPTGAHRSNVLWYNTSLLGKAGIQPPTSLPAFLDALKKLKAAGVTPLCLGGKDPFTTVELFENTLLSTIGAAGWQNMAGDRLDWRSSKVRTALRSFGDILTYADPEASGLTWDAATAKLAAGGCAFESMNDSAYGELATRGGKDFAGVAFPGTEDSYVAVVDVLVAATRAANAKNALAFLGGISAPAVQVPFHQAKGSVPVVRTVDVSSLSPYQQAASKSLWGSTVLLSVAHGEAMSPEFQGGFYDAVSSYERTRDPDAFARTLENAVSDDKIPPR